MLANPDGSTHGKGFGKDPCRQNSTGAHGTISGNHQRACESSSAASSEKNGQAAQALYACFFLSKIAIIVFSAFSWENYRS